MIKWVSAVLNDPLGSEVVSVEGVEDGAKHTALWCSCAQSEAWGDVITKSHSFRPTA